MFLQQVDDPAKRSSGTEEKRAYISTYSKSRLCPAPNECTEATDGVNRDPDLTSVEVAKLCNNALSFEGTLAQIRGIDNMLVVIDRLSAMFHVALCQAGDKMGGRSKLKWKDEEYCYGEMFGASTGKCHSLVAGGKKAAVVWYDGTFMHRREVWDETVDGNRVALYISSNANNCR